MDKKSSQARTITDTFNILMASGRLPNFSRMWKFGRVLGVNGKADLWSGGGDYQFLESPDFINIVSDNNGDKLGSVGAFNVIIHGLDGSWNIQKETIGINGTSPVKSKFRYIRLFRAEIKFAGDSGGNIGTVSMKDESTGVVRAIIDPGANQTLMAIYTIPVDHVGYLVRYYTNLTPLSPATKLSVELRARKEEEVFRINDPLGLSNECPYVSQSYEIPLGPYPGKTDIKIQVDSSQSCEVRGGFLLVLEKGGKTYSQKGFFK